MNRSRELLLIRYISFFILIYELFIEKSSFSIVNIMFILMLIINNQLRIFYIKNKYIMLASLAIEIIMCPLIQLQIGGTILYYLIGSAIDIFQLKNKYFRYSAMGIILIIVLLPKFSYSIDTGIVYFVVFVFFFILLNCICNLYNTKIQAQNLYDKLRVSEDKLIEANDELEGYVSTIEEITILKERNRISREIHDSVGHALSTAMIQLSAMEAIADKDNSNLKEMSKNLREFINESFQDVKRAVSELKPDEYDNYQGLLRIQEVCKNFEKMSGVKVNVILIKGEWSLSTKQVNHLYRITQEVLSNSLRHGKATNIKVIMNFTEDDFVISFNDNGVGTEEIKETGVGLKSIRERTEELNGVVNMKSNLGKGFFVKLTIPKEKEI